MAKSFDPGKYWVGQKQELNAFLAGRFRESGLSTGQIVNDSMESNSDAEDYFVKEPNHYMSRFDQYRIASYRINKLLYMGDYYDVFRYMRYLLDADMLTDRSGGYFRNRNKMIVYVAINILGLAARKLADLVAVETPDIVPWEGANAKVEAAIKRIYDNSNFPSLCYNSCLSSGVKGDSVWIIEAIRDDPDDLTEIPKIRIRRTMPEIWFPTLDSRDLFSFKEHVFAWKVKAAGASSTDGKNKEILRRQVYLPGAVLHLANYLNGDIVGDAVTPQQLFELTGEVMPLNRIFTIARESLVVHLPNLQFDEQHPFGISDFQDVKPLADELSHRASQLAAELDKHANLYMRGPNLGNDQLGGGRYIKYGLDEPAPEYIQLPVQAMDVMLKEMEMVSKWILILMEVSPGLVGLKEGAGVQRAEALRIECSNSVVKSQRKQLYLTIAIQKAFKAAMLLENEMGIDTYPVEGVVGVKWRDGLPDSPTEKALLAQIRTGGKATQSVEDAIRYQDGDSADKVLERLMQEKGASEMVIDETEKPFPDEAKPETEQEGNDLPEDTI